MKNLDDPAQFTDREKAITDKDTARKLCKCGDIKGQGKFNYSTTADNLLLQVT